MCAGALLLAPACGPSGGADGDAGPQPDSIIPDLPDEDGDGIADVHEGRDQDVDTDGDGTPDYLDDDSDGDGIPDYREAGDNLSGTPPVDSDNDGIPDFRDTDADNNGILDGAEGADDPDGDGIGNFADLDNDGDNIQDVTEIGGNPASPRDIDLDGTPDYLDTDSDNDSILDKHELIADPDLDGLGAYIDLDSDGDCIPDSLEAGDTDPTTPPADTDGDGRYDFLDIDADNDGLADGTEDANCNGTQDTGETDANDNDSDGDGVSDLVEVAAGTDPNNNSDNPQANGDFVFLEPYEAPPTPTEDRLDFSTAFQNVDIYFMIDYSGSMAGEISSIYNAMNTVITSLVCGPGENPSTTGCIPSLETGVGQYGGQAGVDPVLEHFKDINAINLTSDGPNSTQANFPSMAPGWGNEYHLQAMNMALTGTCASDSSRFGRVCYRNNSLRLLVMATDEAFSQDPHWGSGAYQAYVDHAYNNNVRAIGVYSGGNVQINMASLQSGGNYLFPVLTSTSVGTPACNALSGNPFYSSNGSRAIILGTDAQAANALTCAVQAVTQFVAQDVRAVAVNDPTNQDGSGNPVDAPSAFIQRIEVFMDNSAACPNYPTTQDSNGDGYPDVFVNLLPGEPVCWKIYVKQNNTVPATTEPQMFRATIEVYGVGNSLLDSRDVFFLVPPEFDQVPID